MMSQFYDLNVYLIRKTAKKFEKFIADSSTATLTENEAWKKFPSFTMFRFLSQAPASVEQLKTKCVQLYGTIFRQTYSELAMGELEFYN